MFIRGIIEELLYFVRGQTDSKILSRKKVRIWEGNTTNEFIASRNLPYNEGVMGPLYGYQWRTFNKPYKVDESGDPINDISSNNVDQLSSVINLIKTDPYSRRILLTSYNPAQAEEGVLFPCHSIVIQFYVHDRYLDMLAVSRSCDFFLGAPFNIASYAIFMMMIARVTGLSPRHLNIQLADVHIYAEHYEACTRQLKRSPYKFPKMYIDKDLYTIKDMEDLEYDDFGLCDYSCHPGIKAQMVP